MYKHICNLKKSKRDKRDFIYKGGRERPVVPANLDYRPELQRVRNQGRQGTCYAQSAACMKEWQEKRDNGFDEYMSPQFFYNNRPNKYDDNPNNDDGMYGRDVMKLLVSTGICRERVYKYGRIERKSDIPQNVYIDAMKYRVKSYARIESISALKESLVKNGPCLVGFPVYNYGGRFWKKHSKFAQREGGHAVTIVGYISGRPSPLDCGFIIRNSWGSDWGDEGYTIYPYQDWGAHWEIWTTVDIDGGEVYVPPPRPKWRCDIL